MLIAFPSHDVVWTSTVTMTNEDTEYPATNVQTNDPADTAKSTTTSTTFTIVPGGSITPVALLIANTNAASGTLANNAGSPLSVSLTFPSRTPDGKQRNKWVDLRGLANRTASQFTVALSKSGSAVLEVGRLCLVVELQSPEVLVAGAGASPVFGHTRPGQVENVSRGGTTWRRVAPWAAPRKMVISTLTSTALEILQQLEAECLGLNRGFLLVPNDDDVDGLFTQCAMEDFEYTREQPDSVDEIQPMRMTLQEIAMGLPPALT